MSSPIILVVDDEESIRRLLTRMLHRMGVIHTVGSGAQALLLMQGGEPVDVVLSDQMMPEMTGDQLLAEVSRRWPDTERILMSGCCDLDVVDQGLCSGEIGNFVHKPLNSKDLREIQDRANSAHARRVSKSEPSQTGSAKEISERP